MDGGSGLAGARARDRSDSRETANVASASCGEVPYCFFLQVSFLC